MDDIDDDDDDDVDADEDREMREPTPEPDELDEEIVESDLELDNDGVVQPDHDDAPQKVPPCSSLPPPFLFIYCLTTTQDDLFLL